jgi:outer membrane protein assembly factor BamD
MIRFHTLTILVSFLLCSCGEYEKLLKSDDYDLKYQKAMEYYENGKYVKAATVFEQIIPRFRGTDKAEEINFFHAKSYYGMKNYVLAGHYFRSFVSTFFHSQYTEEADFLSAYCYYLLSPRPNLDQENSYDAINAFTLFKKKFPNSDKVNICDEYIEELNEKLVEKSYLNAKLYYDLGQYKAANVALRNSLADYPDTEYREELMFLLLKSNFLLAENSVIEKQQERYQATVDEYYSLIGEFPESQFKKEADKIYNNALERISINDFNTQ